jgi:hypothetical protein
MNTGIRTAARRDCLQRYIKEKHCKRRWKIICRYRENIIVGGYLPAFTAARKTSKLSSTKKILVLPAIVPAKVAIVSKHFVLSYR